MSPPHPSILFIFLVFRLNSSSAEHKKQNGHLPILYKRKKMTSLLLLIKTDSDPTAGIISSRQHIKGNGTKQPRQQSSQPILTCHSLMHVSTLPMFRDLLVFNCSSRTTYTVKLQIAECKDSFPSNTP